MNAHNATIKAIPLSIGQKKRAYFAFFVPGLGPPVCLSPGDHRKLSPLITHSQLSVSHRQERR
jgi:hypothetical protein